MKNDTETRLIEELTTEQATYLCQWFQREWWTRGRSRNDVDLMLKNSSVVLALETLNHRLVGFSRVISDFVFKALVLDIMIDPSLRGKGLGRFLIESLLNHPKLKDVGHFELYCLPEMAPLYHQWEFTQDLGRLTFMRLTRKGESSPL